MYFLPPKPAEARAGSENGPARLLVGRTGLVGAGYHPQHLECPYGCDKYHYAAHFNLYVGGTPPTAVFGLSLL